MFPLLDSNQTRHHPIQAHHWGERQTFLPLRPASPPHRRTKISPVPGPSGTANIAHAATTGTAVTVGTAVEVGRGAPIPEVVANPLYSSSAPTKSTTVLLQQFYGSPSGTAPPSSAQTGAHAATTGTPVTVGTAVEVGRGAPIPEVVANPLYSSGAPLSKQPMPATPQASNAGNVANPVPTSSTALLQQFYRSPPNSGSPTPTPATVQRLASQFTSDLVAVLPASASSLVETALARYLAVAIPEGLTPAQRKDLEKDFRRIWKTHLTRSNLGPISGKVAKGLATGVAVDALADSVGDFAASAVAKRTSNTFVIEFARASAQLSIVDAYAGKSAGIPGVLAANGSKIVQAASGLGVDTNDAAKSFQAFQVQVNDLISRAQSTADPIERKRLLTSGIKAINALNELRDQHPLINTLSNMDTGATIETLRGWTP